MTSSSSTYFQRLPPELISRIFVNCLPKVRHPNRDEAPLNISAVCSSWRQIATSTPRIWSSIYISFVRGQLRCSYPEILKNWISRSCNHGFSFSVTWERSEDYFGDDDVEWDVDVDVDVAGITATTEVLVENCSKWQNISVDAYEDTFGLTSPLLAVIPQGTKQLQQISVHTSKFPIVQLFTSPLIHLTHLSFAAYTEFNPSKSYALMENLCSLSLLADNPNVMALLLQTTRLQQAELRLTLRAGDTYPTGPVTLPDLHTLDLVVAPEGNPEVMELRFRRFLDNLRVPALKTLFIGLNYVGDHDTQTLHWEGVVDLVSRSGTTLQNIEVHANTIASFPQFLEAFPNLKHLSIPDKVLRQNKKLICHLAHKSYSSASPHMQLCPKFESLRITCQNYQYLERIVNDIRSIVDISATAEANSPLVLVLPSRIRRSLSPPSGGSLEIVEEGDWVARRQYDLYEKIGANWTWTSPQTCLSGKPTRDNSLVKIVMNS